MPRFGAHAFRGLLVLCLVLAAASGAIIGRPATQAGAQELAFTTAEAAPADTLLYLTLNVDTESDQFTTGQRLAEQSGILDLVALGGLDEEAIGEFGDILAAAAGGELAFAAGAGAAGDLAGSADLPVDTEAIDDVIAATPVAGDQAETDWFSLVVRAEDPEAAFEAARTILEDSAETIDQDVIESDYEGYEILSIPGITSPDGETTDALAIALVEDFVLISDIESALEPFIETITGARDSLATNENFGEVVDLLSGEYLLFAYLNGAELVELGLVESEQSDEEVPFELGALDAYTGLRVYADAEAPGFRLDTVSVPAGNVEPPAGAVNFDSTADERVPGETLLFVNGTSFGDTLAAQLLVSIVFGMMGSGDMGFGAAGTPAAEEAASPVAGIDTDVLLGLFSGEYVIALSLPGVAALLDPGQLFLLVASGVSNPAAAQVAIDAIDDLVQDTAGENTTFDTAEVDGQTVYQASNSDAGLPIVVQYGVVDDELVIGLGESIETYVEGPASPLAENEQYVATFDALGAPEERGGIVYIDLLQVGGLVQLIGGLAGGSTSDIEDASPDCAEYADQEAAQAAYDEDPVDLFDLDQDFDGIACEDYFADTAATPEPTLADVDLSGLVSYGQVQYVTDEYRGTNGLLLLDVEEE